MYTVSRLTTEYNTSAPLAWSMSYIYRCTCLILGGKCVFLPVITPRAPYIRITAYYVDLIYKHIHQKCTKTKEYICILYIGINSWQGWSVKMSYENKRTVVYNNIQYRIIIIINVAVFFFFATLIYARKSNLNNDKYNSICIRLAVQMVIN